MSINANRPVTILQMIALAIASVFSCGVSLAADNAEKPLRITGATIVDVVQQRLLKQTDVLIDGTRIVKLMPADEPLDAETRRLDVKGAYVLPGLIDLHTHLLLRQYDEILWADQVLKESLELRTIRAVRAAQDTVEAGFTTIRDLGTEGAGFADVALKRAVAERVIPGPRIFASTRAIVTTGGYAPQGFDPRWRVPIAAQVADGPDGVRRAVREQIAAGADWIKVYADFSRRPDATATPTFSPAELQAVVEESRSAGLPVAAHATVDEGIRRSVMAGISTIEHGYHASEDVLRLMKEHDVTLCPTLAASEAKARYAGWKPGEPDPRRIRDTKTLIRRARKVGVRIACGSDAGVFKHGDNVRELELMQAYGMTPGEVILAATYTAATVLRKENELGKVAEGYLADLIVVRQNPLESVSAMRNPILVIQDGRIVVDRR